MLSEKVRKQMIAHNLKYPENRNEILALHEQDIEEERIAREKPIFDAQNWPCWNWRSGCLGHLRFVRFIKTSNGYAGGYGELKILQCDTCNEVSSW